MFEKIQHPFLIKTFTKLGRERNFLKLISDIYEKPTDNIILTGEGLNTKILWI